MAGITKTQTHLRSTMALAMAVSQGSLIDFETTGRPRIDRSHEVVTLGYMEENRVIITQRKGEDREGFYEEVKQILRGLPKPYFSYNAGFERSVFETELGISTKKDDFVDIMGPWKVRADGLGLKWPKLGELISEPEEYFEHHVASGKDVPDLWKGYLGSRDEKILRVIMEHCLSDILREAVLLIRYQA